MEAWRQREKYYEDLGRPKDKPTEDKIARRVLRAAGFSNAEKGIDRYEKNYLGEVEYTTPLWPRTKRMLYDAAWRRDKSLASFDVDAFTGGFGKEFLERVRACLDSGKKPMYFLLIDGEAYGYTVSDSESLSSIKRPFEALVGPGGVYLIRQSAKTLISDIMSEES